MSKVSIVIPNWNGEEKLKKNLPKVLETEGVDEFIVSDDGSTDGSLTVLKKFPVRVIVRAKNGGFSSNVNTGVSRAAGDLIFLLNSDAVPKKDCLKYILPHFQNPKVFSVSFNTGGSWSWAKFKGGYFWHYMSDEKAADAHETLWASGGSMVFKKELWDKLGGFDTLFDPFYEEDVDLGYRAIKRGLINLWEPKALVEHYKQVGVIAQHFSENRISRVAQRNQLIFIWKNITSKALFKQHKWALFKKILANPKYFGVFLDTYKRKDQIIEKRRQEEKESVVTDEVILSKFE